MESTTQAQPVNPVNIEGACPHCSASITLKQAIIILNGSGFKRFVRVRVKDETEGIIEAGLCNPNEVEVLE
jgi:hypothetical protein